MAAVSETIPNGLFSGFLVETNLVPGPPRFAVNFRTQANGGDYAFHFNGRFDDHNSVVRNSCVNGTWGHEEREKPYFPFTPGRWSKILIVVTEDRYRVFVDDNHFVDYKHRITDLSSIKYVEVEGVQRATLRTG